MSQCRLNNQCPSQNILLIIIFHSKRVIYYDPPTTIVSAIQAFIALIGWIPSLEFKTKISTTPIWNNNNRAFPKAKAIGTKT